MCNAVNVSDLLIRLEIYEKTRGDILCSFLKALSIDNFLLTINVLEAIEELLKLDEVLGAKNTEKKVVSAF
jgi:hypothetical protein